MSANATNGNAAEARSSVRWEWTLCRALLATWTRDHLLNRDDAHGRYRAKAKRDPSNPDNDVWTVKAGATKAVLERHFAGEDGFCSGLHTTRPDDETSRWGVVDIDCHDGEGDPEANRRFALALYGELVKFGFHPILIDSNGRGGYHLWIIFDAPLPTDTVFKFLKWVVRDWKNAGLSKAPETFPKQGKLGLRKFGNWVRLPGLHHTHDHWSRVWDGESGRWLDGDPACRAILGTVGDPGGLIPAEALRPPESKAKRRGAKARPRATTWKMVAGRSSDAELAAAAIEHLPSSYCSDYDLWLKVMFALKKLGPVGLALFHQFSAGCPEKYDRAVCDEKWKTATDDGGVSLGSLFKWAEEAGWSPPWRKNGHPEIPRPAYGPGDPIVMDYDEAAPEFWDIGADEDAQKAAARRLADFQWFANFDEHERPGSDGEDGETFKVPRLMHQVADALDALKMPKLHRVEERLFMESPGHRPTYIDNATRLFAVLARWSSVEWASGPSCVSQEQFFEHMRMTAPRYEAIEFSPHFPAMHDLFYMHPSLPEPTDKRLAEFLGLFSPASEIDRELLKAFAMTLVWGGAPGTRPAFLLTGDAADPEQGRGIGKTTTMDALARLVGGFIDVSPKDDIDRIKTRILSDTGNRSRVVRLDNLKSLKLSWGDLENQITSPIVSGHNLYRGEGQRPNTLVYALTLNGGALSKDMAQRCCIIRLKRPAFRADWTAEVNKLVTHHRWDILADLGALLGTEVPSIQIRTRWGPWERDVLSRTSCPSDCQRVLLERQGDFDDDDEEQGIVAAKFKELIRGYQFNPDDSVVFIPSGTAADWLEQATKEKRSTNRATTFIRGLGIPELRAERKPSERGWIWQGKDAPRGASPVHIVSRVSPNAENPWKMTVE